MLFKIISYLDFLFKATNKHGIHSPFVYDFTVKCLNGKTNSNIKNSYTAIKKQLLRSEDRIEVTDFGAGSSVFSTSSRPISRIAKVAGISDPKAFLMNRIVSYFKPRKVLELGTSVGLSSVSMALGNDKAQITTVEGCPQTAAVAAKLFKENTLETIEVVVGAFDEKLPELLENRTYDLVYIDGNHQRSATWTYFEQLLPAIPEHGVIIFDDINWSAEMQKVWQAIKNHDQVTLTIDTFFWGMVFFKKSLVKQHFKIRCGIMN